VTDKASQIVALLAPTVAALGLELWGAEYLPGSGNALLRLYIDVDEASAAEGRVVGIEECEAVSREVSAILDVEDPISGHYTLEVSSPGLDRPLFTSAQCARFAGEAVKLTLRVPQDGRRRVQGRIVSVEGEAVALDVDGTPVVIEMDNIDKARLVPDWAALGLVPQQKKGKK